MAQKLEQVEKLVEKTGVSYSEAKAALEQANGDMLDALIYLEEQGKIRKETAKNDNAAFNTYTTNRTYTSGEHKESKTAENFKETTKSFGEWLKSIFDKGNSNYLEMYRDGERKFSLPVTVFVILLIFGFWIVLPLMIVALFFNCRFRFSGNELGKESVNNAMGKATDIADGIKSEVVEIVNNNENK